jgi:methionine-gamma-lyase
VATRAVYGSTRSLLTSVLAGLGVTTVFVDATDHEAVEAALAASSTRVLYTETISNPTIIVADHVRLAALAHRHGAAYVVDNTFASPYVCRPAELGADLVIESATKFLGGHSDVIAGVVAGRRELIDEVRRIQTETGGTLAPLAAFLVLRGIQTLAVRMDRHAGTALALAAWLERQEGVIRVHYPGLPSHPQREVAARQLHGGGGMLAFELAGNRSVGRAFIDALSLTELTASLGSVHTMVVHPPSTSHRQLSDHELVATGIGPGLLRCSVGLEDLDDLIEDFGRALAAVATARRAEDHPTAATI